MKSSPSPAVGTPARTSSASRASDRETAPEPALEALLVSAGSHTRRGAQDPLVFGPEELELAELRGLEAGGRVEWVAEPQEVLRPMVSRTWIWWTSRSWNHVHAAQQGRRALRGGTAAGGRLGDRARPSTALVQDLLEPQLVDLVDDDEEHLVVRRRVPREAALELPSSSGTFRYSL